jgi:uncharacterized protein (TIGR02246 family)
MVRRGHRRTTSHRKATIMSVTDPAALHDAFTAAINTSDVDALVALYEPDGIAVELDGSECTGAGPIRAMCAALAESIETIHGSTRKLYVTGDLALSSGRWAAKVRLPDGTLADAEGVTSEVSRRQPDGTWRFVIDDPLF